MWVTARSGEQIRENMFRRLTGAEEGLAGLWNFDDPEQPGRDASPHGFHGTLRNEADLPAISLPTVDSLVIPASMRGTVTDTDGRALAGVDVLVTQTGLTNTTITTDSDGGFLLVKPVPGETVTLEARRNELAVAENFRRDPMNRLQLALRASKLAEAVVERPSQSCGFGLESRL